MRWRFPWFAVDLFAGAGGTTTGAAMVGVRVLHALNHWLEALDTHRRNHPWVKHHREDVHLINPRELTCEERRRGPRLVAASPSCVGHSPARGKDSHEHDEARMTAHGVNHVAEILQPELLVIENVPAFLEWIPPAPPGFSKLERRVWKKDHLTGTVQVYRGTSEPVLLSAGSVFLAWKALLEALGYTLTVNLLNAADFGVPQERERVFITGSLKRRLAPILSPRTAHRPAWDIIDWQSGTWNSVLEKNGKPRPAATIARWESGRARFGRRFLMPYYGSGSGKTGRSMDRPIGTIPAADVWVAVDGDRMRALTINELRKGMGFPEGYILEGTRADLTKQLGNAVPPPLAAGVFGQVLEAA